MKYDRRMRRIEEFQGLGTRYYQVLQNRIAIPSQEKQPVHEKQVNKKRVEESTTIRSFTYGVESY